MADRGVSPCKCAGFQIDPYHGDTAADTMADFFERCQKEPGHWDDISQGALDLIMHAAPCVGPVHRADVEHGG